MPASSVEEGPGTISDELSLISRRGAGAAAQPLQQLGMLSSGRERVGLPRGPHKAPFRVPFTVCISHICRAVMRPPSGVLVRVMGMSDRCGSSSVTFYVSVRSRTCVERVVRRSDARARVHTDQDDLS